MHLFKEIGSTFHAIKEDFKAGKRLDPSVKSGSDIFLFSASFHGLMLYRFSHLFWNCKMEFLAMLLRYLSRVLYKMDIHPAANIEAGIFIDHGMGVVIGETASVGRGTLIYHGVTLGTARVMQGKRHPTIGRNVLIGANATILGPIKIGDGARIGANSVVLRDVPESATAVGNPARIIRKRVIDCEFNLNDRKDTDHTLENDEPLAKIGDDESRR